jgi:hypothetical protein
LSADDRNGQIRELNSVRLVVFRTGCRQCPNAASEVDLVPTHPRDLVAALPGQGENLDDCSVGPA